MESQRFKRGDSIVPDIEPQRDHHDHHDRSANLQCVVCGSEDDGKRTLIDRLVSESRRVLADRAVAHDEGARNARTADSSGAQLDEVVAAECRQGIGSEEMQRLSSIAQRTFIIADAPGHEQDVRDLLIGVSTADVVILIVDARKGVLAQTRRHSVLVSLLGISKVIVAVNKMDLVSYAAQPFLAIVEDYQRFAKDLGLTVSAFVPMAAVHGDNVTLSGASMPWYQGAPLLDVLESLKVDPDRLQHLPFRLPVRSLDHSAEDAAGVGVGGVRGVAGVVSSGVLRVGERVRVQPSGRESTVTRIVGRGNDLMQAVAGQPVTLTLADQVEIVCGDVISAATAPAGSADQFECTIVWMHDEPMFAGRQYRLAIGAATVTATVTDIKYQINVNTLEHLAAKTLEPNAIGVCNISLDRRIAFDPYAENHHTGGFILADRLSERAVGAGMLHFALRRADNIHIQHVDVDKAARAQIKGQAPCVLWFTGLSGAGKSTIANLVEKRLRAMGKHTYLLDGDNVRHGLNKDLGFTDADRVENIRRVAEVARLMVDAGLIVMTAFISPFISERRMARGLLQAGEFIEVFVDTPIALAEARDPKGLYKKARRGELKNFTGIDSPYERPENPELCIDSGTHTPEQAVAQIVALLEQRGFLQSPQPTDS